MAHLAHYREAHPLVFVITHWINLIAMIVLIVTGFCIHFFYKDSAGIRTVNHPKFSLVIIKYNRVYHIRVGCCLIQISIFIFFTGTHS